MIGEFNMILTISMASYTKQNDRRQARIVTWCGIEGMETVL